jgi:hypothetical protein
MVALRVDVFAPDKGKSSTATIKGIRIGDSELHVKKVYGGRVAVETHHYDPDGHYLNIESGNYELRFETDGKKVVSFYAGMPEAVAFVEGCS